MIFQGQGNRAGLLERLDAQFVLDGWQLKNGPFPNVEFRDKDIRHMSTERAVLDESRFQDCHLEEGEFLQSNLQDVSLEGCELNQIGFISCQLRSSRWKGTRLRGSSFKGCAAPRLRMNGVILENCRFEEVEVNRGTLDDCCFWQTSLAAEHPSGTTGFRNSTFTGCLFLNSHIRGAALAFTSLSDCIFLNCQFFQVDWDCVEKGDCRFIDCTGGPVEQRPTPLRDLSRSWEKFEQEELNGTV